MLRIHGVELARRFAHVAGLDVGEPLIVENFRRIGFSRDARQVERQVRAFNPAPGAFFEYRGERFRILAAHVEEDEGPAGELLDNSLLIGCGHGSIRPAAIQRAGKGAMSAGELLRRFDMPAGSRVDA